MLARFIYLVRRALNNMRQSPVLCSAAIGTVAVSLAILAFFSIVVINAQRLTGQWSEEVQVIAYLDDPPSEQVLEGWRSRLRKLPQVEGVEYVTRSAAFERFRRSLGADADLLEGLDPEILPASLEIALVEEHRSRAGVEAVVGHLKREHGLADLRYGRDWLERFESFVELLKFAGAVLGGFLLFAALFIVANTIKLTLYARRDELEIMSLVGATPWFIKTPFLIEGALQGAAGGLIALGATYALHHLVLKDGLGGLFLFSGFQGIAYLPFSYQALLLTAGILLGAVGSLLSLRKLIRV